MVPLDSRDFCVPTGILLQSGARYRLEFASGLPADWNDGGNVAVSSPAGVDAGTPGLNLLQRTVYTAGLPFKRLWRTDFFVPVARIGAGGLDNYALKELTNEITAQTSGELFLFVNDAIAPLNVRPFCLGWAASCLEQRRGGRGHGDEGGGPAAGGRVNLPHHPARANPACT